MSESHAFNEWLDARRKLAVLQARIAKGKSRPMDWTEEKRLSRECKSLANAIPNSTTVHHTERKVNP